MRKTELKRGKGLARGKGPARKPRKRYDPAKAAKFWEDVCLVHVVHKGHLTTTPLPPRRARCLCGHTAVDAHHILPKQFIYSACKTARVDPDDYLWDVRNGLALCRECHDGHEGGSERLLRSQIPQVAWAFIASIDHLSGTLAATETILRAYP